MTVAEQATLCVLCNQPNQRDSPLTVAPRLCAVCLLRQAADLLAPPETIAEYRVIRELGRGAMGAVYLATQPVPQKRVAIKVIHQELDERARWLFREEVEILGRLEHQNIVPIYDGRGLEHVPPFFVMRWIDGGTLEDATLRMQYRSPRSAALLMITIAQAVQFAHQRGVLHRDLKPANVLIDHAGTPYVSDFGVAKLLGSEEPAPTATVAGSLGFMSPEQAHAIDRPVTMTSDVYGLGAIFYQLLTGRPPRAVRDLGQLVAEFKRGGPIAPRRLSAAISPDLEQVCLCALAHDPNDRYRSAAEFADDLRAVLDQQPPQLRHVRRPSRLIRLAYWARRHKLAAAASIQMLLLCLYIGSMPLLLVREVERTIRHQNSFSAGAQAGAAMSELRALESRVAALSREPNIVALAQHPDLSVLPPQLQAQRGTDIDSLWVLAADGSLRAQVPKPPNPDRDLLNYAFRDYFRGALSHVAAGKRDVYISRVVQSTGDDALMLTFAAPLFDGSGRHVGVLVAAVKARATFGAVQMNCSGTGACITALLGPRDRDRPGQPLPHAISVLAAPGLAAGEERDLDSQLTRQLCSRLGCMPSDLDQFQAQPHHNLLVLERVQDPIAHSSSIAAFAPVGRTGLIVMVSTPDSAVRALTSQIASDVKAFLWIPPVLGLLAFGALFAVPSAWAFFLSRRRNQ